MDVHGSDRPNRINGGVMPRGPPQSLCSDRGGDAANACHRYPRSNTGGFKGGFNAGGCGSRLHPYHGGSRGGGPGFRSEQVECRIAAIRAIQVAEVESLLARLRLIRSYFTKEQLETPVLQFFKENLPNISVIKNEKSKIVELEWKDAEDHGGNVQVVGGVPHSVRSDLVKSNFFDIANLQIPDFALDDTSENQMPGYAVQTPGETSNRLSFRMTPKTLRLPKKGEMLMSVRGSPLGVYKEENMEAIHGTLRHSISPVIVVGLLKKSASFNLQNLGMARMMVPLSSRWLS